MKKIIVGGIVGGILLFLWQFLSWTVLELHSSSTLYTPKQDSIISYLNTQFSETGQYIMPNLPPDATEEQHEAIMKTSEGKPWAVVSYHKAYHFNMGSSMARGLVANIIMVCLLCWIITRMQPVTFGKAFLATLFTGFIVFINAPYTLHIWYETAGVVADLKDAIIGWGITGLWLGWWLKQ